MQQQHAPVNTRLALVREIPAARTLRVLRVLPFGPDRDLELDGRRLGVGRLKVVELAGLFALHPSGVARAEVTRLLFPESEPRQAGNYFRQVTHKLREMTGIALVRRTSGLVALPDDIRVLSADAEVEAANERARASRASIDELRDVLGCVTGRYLESSTLPWAEQRRNRIDVIEEETRIALARLLAVGGEYADARAECERVLIGNSYSDSAYRTLFAIEREIGSEVSCMAVYRRAADALREIGLAPGDARRLFLHGELPVGCSADRRAGRRRSPSEMTAALGAVVTR